MNHYEIYKLRYYIDESLLTWSVLSSNINAIYLLKENLDKIDWKNLSKNPNAIDLLEKKPEKICWYKLIYQ